MTQRYLEQLRKRTEEEVRGLVVEDKGYVQEDVIEDRQRAYRQAATNYIR